MKELVVMFNAYVTGKSGGDIWMLEVLKRLRSSFNITIMTSKKGREFCIQNGLTDVKYIITTKENKLSNVVTLYLRRMIVGAYLARKFDAKPEIVFASSTFLPDIVPLIFLNGLKIAIYHMKTPSPLFDLKWRLRPPDSRTYWTYYLRRALNWLNEEVALRILSFINADIFALETSKDYLGRYGFPPDKIHLTTNGIDLDFINTISGGEIRYEACWVGRPTPQKGFKDLLETWKKVTERIPNANLVLMGKDVRKYKPLIERLSIEKNITIAGYVSEKEKYKKMKQSRMLLFPSYYESFPIAALESIACGLPIVAYDLPIWEKLYGDYVRTAPLGNTERLAEEVCSQLAREENKKFEDLDTHCWGNISKRFKKDICNIIRRC